MSDIIIILIINILGIKWFGAWFILIEMIAFLGFLIWLWFKKYRPVIDNVSLFTGAPGTGKTKIMTDFALYKYKSIRRTIIISNFFTNLFNKLRKNKKELLELPILYSNYPIRISKYEWSRVLTNDILLLQKRIPLRSVIAISEFSSKANNQDWGNDYARFNLDEFIRFIRQYTKGGYLFMDDQSSDLILAQIRRRVGKVYNMMSFRKLPLLNIGIVNIRHLSISEDIKVIEEGQAESLRNTSWFPVFFYRKTYDTYAFSERIKNMKVDKSKQFKGFKTNIIEDLPIDKRTSSSYKEPKTLNED